ncbi:MAG: N-acetylmuramoyl-L-alanine amidase [Myxococcales bacterium]|nr:MAG: N-acetylmuramoyl-L-alanine amidase [Myxococcales bacterium]
MRLEEVVLPQKGSSSTISHTLSSSTVSFRFDGPVVFKSLDPIVEHDGLRRWGIAMTDVIIPSGLQLPRRWTPFGPDNAAFRFKHDKTVVVEFLLPNRWQVRVGFLPAPFQIVVDFDTEQVGIALPTKPFVVVLDPGHGGQDTGAKAADGNKEADYALDIARRVQLVIKRLVPGAKVFLTRKTDRFITLEERATMANRLEADLLFPYT